MRLREEAARVRSWCAERLGCLGSLSWKFAAVATVSWRGLRRLCPAEVRAVQYVQLALVSAEVAPSDTSSDRIRQ